MVPYPDTAGGFAIRDDEFEAVRRLLRARAGIALGASKREMVCSRLAKRLRHYGLNSFTDYLALLTDESAECQEFINCLTTNKTDFFREAHHFEFLRDTVIPQARARGKRFRVWSAGCSTGEEPYTLALTLAEHGPAADGWDVRILASDIDTAVLATAERGVYAAERVGVPPAVLRNYFLRGTGANAGTVAVRPELKDRIAFRRINLTDDPWPVRTRFDAIFCRNVVIYFDRETQHRLLTRFAEHLVPGGYLFLGHSENIHWLADTFAPLGGTVYRLRSATDTPPPIAAIPKEPEHTIVLGDVKAVRGPGLLKTLLGSCVSACLFDPETGVGGMNHFSLPGVSDEGANARYGAYAMELLATAVMKMGADRSRLRAKVFGGGRVIDVASEHLNVGARNAEFVLKYLSAEGIPVVGQALGGTRGMMVRFRPHTGQALVKPLPVRELPPVLAREEEFGRELRRRALAPAENEITLF